MICPSCEKRAIAKVSFEDLTARLLCVHCGHNKETTIALKENGILKMAAHHYSGAELWLTATLKKEVFWALKDQHLEYLERYIGATLREHKDRTHFTLLEKLPKFYHDSRNRDDLLKIIFKLKSK